ncbi:MAG: hypothetical protein A2516_06595 [Alphaproteobacteria bacterium RIFOXYD12_FULL_60_8]|nr:MAG: hypothetical protein A2516_06595 [Alphaproteobacteria bacterium RIFOXYD12_FULL_60_8]
MLIRSFSLIVFVVGVTTLLIVGSGDRLGEDGSIPYTWSTDFPNTDFSQHTVPLKEFRGGGPRRDIIPAIDAPVFAASDRADLTPLEPVIGLTLNGQARAYPLSVLIWHEIVNDVVGGVPVAVTFCPLTNSFAVYDRRVGDQVLDFGVSGVLRFSDLILYDRQTESWWQHHTGEGVVGPMAGTSLKAIPARMESLAAFTARAPDGRVLIAPQDKGERVYGENPYPGYDSMTKPPIYEGELPTGITPLARVVAVGGEAWALDLLQAKGRLQAGDMELTWTPGQLSALDADVMAQSRDVGNVTARHRVGSTWEDAIYDVPFAFAFHAFHPQGALHVQ